MLFEIRKYDFDGLAAQSVNRFRFLRLHPLLMRKDQVLMLTAPNAASTFLAGRALRLQGAGLARGALDPVAQYNFLAPPPPHIRFTSHALEQMASWTLIGLELGPPLKCLLGEQGARLGRTHVVFLP